VNSKTNTKYFKQVNWLIEQFSIAVVPSVYSYIKFDYFKKQEMLLNLAL